MTQIIKSEWLDHCERDVVTFDGREFLFVTSPTEYIGIYLLHKDTIEQLSNFVIKILSQTQGNPGISLKLRVQFQDGYERDVDLNLDTFMSNIDFEWFLRKNFGLRLICEDELPNILNKLVELHSRGQIEFLLREEIPIESDPTRMYCQAIHAGGGAFIEKEYYTPDNPKGKYGYVIQMPTGFFEVSKFIVCLDKKYFRLVKKVKTEYFMGRVIISDDHIVAFNDLPKSFLASDLSLRKYLIKNTDLSFLGHAKFSHWKDVPMCIGYNNYEPEEIILREFGFNEDLSTYYTENLCIEKDKITENDIPMTYETFFGQNKLRFVKQQRDEIDTIKEKLKNDLLKNWDEPQVMYPTIAFTMYPIIYPWLKDLTHNKFFLMLKGASGSGKSRLAFWMQQFYGEFKTFLSWTSTEASLNHVGNITKDSMLVVDDFKKENFRTVSEIKWVMRFIQNYSDVTGRQRASGLTGIAEEKIFRAFMLITAEDVVINQTSTLARGIIIDVTSKELDTSFVDRYNKMSQNFSAVTMDYIQYVLKEIDPKFLRSCYQLNRMHFEQLAKKYDLSRDNQARVIQNFSLLALSWTIFKMYLYNQKIDDADELQVDEDGIFAQCLTEMFLKNFDKIDQRKSYERFQKALWDLAETAKLFVEVKNYAGRKTAIGCYEIINNGIERRVKICVNLNAAYNKVDAFLSNEGGIGTSKETLRQQLIEHNMIREVSSGMISFSSGKKVRGVEWIGEYSEAVFS